MKKKVGAEQKTTALRDNYSFRAVMIIMCGPIF